MELKQKNYELGMNSILLTSGIEIIFSSSISHTYFTNMYVIPGISAHKNLI
jgi:hypothetical protein